MKARLVRVDQIRTRDDVRQVREDLEKRPRTRVVTKAAHDWPTEVRPEGRVCLVDDVVTPARVWAGHPTRLVDDAGARVDDGVARIWTEDARAFWTWMLAEGLAERVDGVVQAAPGVIVDGPVPIVTADAVLDREGNVVTPAVLAPGVHYNVKGVRDA